MVIEYAYNRDRVFYQGKEGIEIRLRSEVHSEKQKNGEEKDFGVHQGKEKKTKKMKKMTRERTLQNDRNRKE